MINIPKKLLYKAKKQKIIIYNKKPRTISNRKIGYLYNFKLSNFYYGEQHPMKLIR